MMMKKNIQRILRWLNGLPQRLASPKIGVILMIHLTAFAVVAAFSPATVINSFTKDIGKFLAIDGQIPTIGISFQERFESLGVVLLLISLTVSLVMSLFFRIRTEFRRNNRQENSIAHIKSMNIPSTEIGQLLQNRGYQISTEENSNSMIFRGTKGKSGILGSLLFHTSILLILGGILVSKYASFQGSVALTEGQEFHAATNRYGIEQRGSYYYGDPSKISLRLLKIESDYSVNGATTVASVVQDLSVSNNAELPIYINNGLILADMTVHQGTEIGFSPLLDIRRADGELIYEGYTRIANLKMDGNEIHRDFLELPEEKLRIELEFFPDAVYRNGAVVNRSTILNNPLLRVILKRNGQQLFDYFLSPGELKSADGFSVGFRDVRRWSQLDISDDPGATLLLLGSLFGVIGLSLRLLYVRREIVVTIGPQNGTMPFRVTGSSEKYPATFKEELASLRSKIEELLKSNNILQEQNPAPKIFSSINGIHQHENERNMEEVY